MESCLYTKECGDSSNGYYFALASQTAADQFHSSIDNNNTYDVCVSPPSIALFCCENENTVKQSPNNLQSPNYIDRSTIKNYNDSDHIQCQTSHDNYTNQTRKRIHAHKKIKTDSIKARTLIYESPKSLEQVSNVIQQNKERNEINKPIWTQFFDENSPLKQNNIAPKHNQLNSKIKINDRLKFLLNKFNSQSGTQRQNNCTSSVFNNVIKRTSFSDDRNQQESPEPIQKDKTNVNCKSIFDQLKINNAIRNQSLFNQANSKTLNIPIQSKVQKQNNLVQHKASENSVTGLIQQQSCNSASLTKSGRKNMLDSEANIFVSNNSVCDNVENNWQTELIRILMSSKSSAPCPPSKQTLESNSNTQPNKLKRCEEHHIQTPLNTNSLENYSFQASYLKALQEAIQENEHLRELLSQSNQNSSYQPSFISDHTDKSDTCPPQTQQNGTKESSIFIKPEQPTALTYKTRNESENPMSNEYYVHKLPHHEVINHNIRSVKHNGDCSSKTGYVPMKPLSKPLDLGTQSECQCKHSTNLFSQPNLSGHSQYNSQHSANNWKSPCQEEANCSCQCKRQSLSENQFYPNVGEPKYCLKKNVSFINQQFNENTEHEPCNYFTPNDYCKNLSKISFNPQHQYFYPKIYSNFESNGHKKEQSCQTTVDTVSKKVMTNSRSGSRNQSRNQSNTELDSVHLQRFMSIHPESMSTSSTPDLNKTLVPQYIDRPVLKKQIKTVRSVQFESVLAKSQTTVSDEIPNLNSNLSPENCAPKGKLKSMIRHIFVKKKQPQQASPGQIIPVKTTENKKATEPITVKQPSKTKYASSKHNRFNQKPQRRQTVEDYFWHHADDDGKPRMAYHDDSNWYSNSSSTSSSSSSLSDSLLMSRRTEKAVMKQKDSKSIPQDKDISQGQSGDPNTKSRQRIIDELYRYVT